MPVWFELTVTMLAAYGAGIAIGWGLWGRRGTETTREDSE
jgi:hypothetical protein